SFCNIGSPNRLFFGRGPGSQKIGGWDDLTLTGAECSDQSLSGFLRQAADSERVRPGSRFGPLVALFHPEKNAVHSSHSWLAESLSVVASVGRNSTTRASRRSRSAAGSPIASAGAAASCADACHSAHR